MRILITNDDGYDAGGIAALTSLAEEFSDDVWVVAPDKCYSGMSHSITMGSPLFVDKIEESSTLKRYICTGAPVDCIKIALDELMVEQEPDLILSGINHGANSNISVIYSGTMGAATEGAFYGIPSLGFSLTDHSAQADFEAATIYARHIINLTLEMTPEEQNGLCLNVNVPNIPYDQINGIRYVRQTRGNWREKFVKRADPRGRNYYWMSGHFINAEPEATDTDEWALANGFVAVVPVQMDLTNYIMLEKFNNEEC
ncbi:MAG: 5'/3'-nucleotidase SurE [Mucinivorans sp.]